MNRPRLLALFGVGSKESPLEPLMTLLYAPLQLGHLPNRYPIRVENAFANAKAYRNLCPESRDHRLTFHDPTGSDKEPKAGPFGKDDPITTTAPREGSLNLITVCSDANNFWRWLLRFADPALNFNINVLASRK